MNPLAKILRMIADLEGRNPRPLRVHLRRLGLWLDIMRHRLALPIIFLLVGTAVPMTLIAFYEAETIPLLTGLLQLAIAALLGWEQIQIKLHED